MCNWWENARDVATVVATVATSVAAIAAWRTAKVNRRLTDLEMKPVLGYQYHKDISEGVLRLWFKNMGKGSAQLRAVQMKEAFKVDIGAPLSIGNTGSAYIDVKHQDAAFPPRLQTDLHLSLYYSDIDEKAYRTELKLEFRKYTDKRPNDVFVKSDRTVDLGKIALPKEARHWEPNKPFLQVECPKLKEEWWL